MLIGIITINFLVFNFQSFGLRSELCAIRFCFMKKWFIVT